MQKHILILFGIMFVWTGWIGPGLSCQVEDREFDSPPLTASTNDVTEIIPDVVLRLVEERKIHCKAAGMIASGDLSEGMHVVQGQSLLKLDASKTELQLRRLEAERAITVRQANSTVELDYGLKSIAVAEADLSRVQESNRKFPGLYPEPEVNRLQLLVERAKAEYEKNAFQLEVLALQADAKRIEIAIAQVDLNDRIIHAPIDGMIVEVLRRPGEWVELSEPVAKMVRLDRLRLEVDIPVHFSPKQLESVEAFFITESVPGGYDPAPARVAFIHPEVNPITRTSRVWFDVANPKGVLRPGLSGRLKLKFLAL